MASFTTAQKREVIQRHYPTANNIAVKGNVFFAAFPRRGAHHRLAPFPA